MAESCAKRGAYTDFEHQHYRAAALRASHGKAATATRDAKGRLLDHFTLLRANRFRSERPRWRWMSGVRNAGELALTMQHVHRVTDTPGWRSPIARIAANSHSKLIVSSWAKDADRVDSHETHG
jgi:hypothetical protein